MYEAEELLACLHQRGFAVEARAGSVLVSGPVPLTDGDRQEVRLNKAGFLALLAPAGFCPDCGRPLDFRQRCCWRCHYRACERCGKATGSAFIGLCLACEHGLD